MRNFILTAGFALLFAVSSVAFGQEGLFSDVKVDSVFGESEGGSADQGTSKRRSATRVQNVDDLKLMLAEAGLDGSKLGKQIIGLKKEIDKTSFLVLVTLSKDLEKLEINLMLGNVQKEEALTSDKLIKLMEASRKFAPSYFAYSQERKRLELSHTLENDDVSSQILSSQIDRLARIAAQTEQLWNLDSAAPSNPIAQTPDTKETPKQPITEPNPGNSPTPANTQLVGRWFATKSAKEALAIQLNKNGTFALVYVNDGNKRTSTGTFSISGKSLVFKGKDGTELGGTIGSSSDREFQFTPTNAGSALVFQRAK